MKTLRLNIINLHAPYRVWQKSGKPDHYGSQRDRYLGMTAAMTQIPVPTTSVFQNPQNLDVTGLQKSQVQDRHLLFRIKKNIAISLPLP